MVDAARPKVHIEADSQTISTATDPNTKETGCGILNTITRAIPTAARHLKESIEDVAKQYKRRDIRR